MEIAQAGFSLQRTLWCLQVSCTAKGTPDVLLGDGPGQERRGGSKQERKAAAPAVLTAVWATPGTASSRQPYDVGSLYPQGFSVSVLLTLCVCWSLSRVRLCVPVDCSPPGSSVHGISQARLLEWVAILFSRDLLNPGTKHRSPAPRVDSLPSEPREAHARSFFAVWNQAAQWDILAASLARWPKCPLLVVTTENVSRICQMFPGDRITPPKSQRVILREKSPRARPSCPQSRS